MKARQWLQLAPDVTQPRAPRANSPFTRVWIDCSGPCGRKGHPNIAGTSIDRDSGERVWTCGDCRLTPEARERQVRARLHLDPTVP